MNSKKVDPTGKPTTCQKHPDGVWESYRRNHWACSVCITEGVQEAYRVNLVHLDGGDEEPKMFVAPYIMRYKTPEGVLIISADRLAEVRKLFESGQIYFSRDLTVN